MPLLNKKLEAGIQLCTEEHVLKCKIMGAYIIRHDMLSDRTIEMLASTGLHVKKEGRISFGSNHRGDAIFMEEGVRHIHDVTVTSPTKTATAPQAAKAPGHAMREADKQKRDKYNSFLADKANVLTVLAFEVFGAMSEQVTHLVYRLSNKMINQAPEDATWNSSNFASYWIKALSVTLHRGTALAVKTIASRIIQQERPFDQGSRYVLDELDSGQSEGGTQLRASPSQQVLGSVNTDDTEDFVGWE